MFAAGTYVGYGSKENYDFWPKWSIFYSFGDGGRNDCGRLLVSNR